MLSQIFNILGLVVVLLLTSNPTCFCINSIKVVNSSEFLGFAQGVATWYGEPNGVGTTGGACGFGADVANAPYYGLVSAGNQNLFKHGAGCGNCYLVKCTGSPSCSGNAITVTIADECPGACNSDPIHFDLSGKAFGALAKPGQDNNLRGLGKINIQYQSVRCHYNTPITFKIDKGSNPNYLAFAIEDVGSDGDIGMVQISSPNSKGWLNMQRSWGATWFVNLPNGIRGPFSVKVTTIESKSTFVAYNVIPPNWQPGQSYHG